MDASYKDTNCFPKELWLERELREYSPRISKEEVEEWGESSAFGVAIYDCQSVEDPSQKARLLVYMQVPYDGATSLPPRLRSQQATHEWHGCAKDDLEIWKRLSRCRDVFSARLLGYEEKLQGDEDPVPGGWALYCLLTKVPGVALGTGVLYQENGHNVQEGCFWDLDRPTRDEIRRQLEIIVRGLYAAGVSVSLGGLKSLFWDDDAKRLYIDAAFELSPDGYTNKRRPWSLTWFDSYGLAKSPVESKARSRAKQDVTIPELESEGWKF
ncbi:hypothetical protein ATEIFO6365_0011008400 [Aspergillus terreus]|uniref:Uncharacterized protein n=1 Tax=Aspergillus terreus TaxID=33178 RepID=A0A5M3YYL2_ASPTE|nr:hypothetical protein ATETN484_0006008400 [Aspergillus terreus]GFF19825.1 hypothetical protein ATEIFO6365_0011008400 [Aspergillus terreus]